MEETVPNNIIRKQEKWEKMLPLFKHLENYCTINLRGLQEDSIYFHPKFILDDNTYISSQVDLNNPDIYAFNFHIKNPETNENISVEIHDELLSPIIIGYHTNKEQVLLALSTLNKVRTHINQLNMYVTDYIHNILIGNSVKDVTRAFIQELTGVEKIIEFMQKSKN